MTYEQLKQQSKNYYVMKINKDAKVHREEIQILKDLQAADIPGFPKLVDYGKLNIGSNFHEYQQYNGYEFMVMEKVGMSFKDILQNVLTNFCLIDTLKIGI